MIGLPRARSKSVPPLENQALGSSNPWMEVHRSGAFRFPIFAEKVYKTRMPDRIPFTERKTPWRGVLDLATGRYPPFLFRGGIGIWLPVFHFHESRPESLEPYLAYLANNGYSTVTSEAVAALVLRGVRPGPKSVALCFDDAWASFWTIAAPLLKKYGFQAITYVSPDRVPEAAAPRPQWSPDHPVSPPDPDKSGDIFATWPELAALHASGVADVQAHTRRHAMVFCGPDIVDFIHPGYAVHPHLYPLVRTASGDRFLSSSDLGAPLFPARSRMSDAFRFLHPAAHEAGLRHVREHGGAEFFSRPGWRDELLQCVSSSDASATETVAERDAAIREDLASAKDLLNQRLRTTTVRHMCFPWAIAGEAAVRLARETGYVTAFGDRLFGARAVREGDPPHQLMRLRHQHIFCLPGKNRRWFFSRAPRAASTPAA